MSLDHRAKDCLQNSFSDGAVLGAVAIDLLLLPTSRPPRQNGPLGEQQPAQSVTRSRKKSKSNKHIDNLLRSDLRLQAESACFPSKIEEITRPKVVLVSRGGKVDKKVRHVSAA
jgi:hypothetical protein